MRVTTVFAVVIGLLAAVGIGTTLLSDHLLNTHAENKLFEDVATVPHTPVALVLGTTAGARSRPNAYFVNRIRAAAALYHAGKVFHLLLTGDNGTMSYNEPMDMFRNLLTLGVDSSAMTLDFAGFDTYDSVVRAKKVFGQDRLLIVSQRFHNERALYIAKANGIDAIAFDADETGITRNGWSWIRERGARLKMWKDILLDAQPHFLGEPITLGTQGSGTGSR